MAVRLSAQLMMPYISLEAFRYRTPPLKNGLAPGNAILQKQAQVEVGRVFPRDFIVEIFLYGKLAYHRPQLVQNGGVQLFKGVEVLQPAGPYAAGHCYLSRPLCSAISRAFRALIPLLGVPTLSPAITYSPHPKGTYCSASSRETSYTFCTAGTLVSSE